MSERDDQKALFSWAEWRSNQDERLALMYAVPNGQYRPGQRMEPGLKPGVPDVCLPVPCGDYHGLYLELKHGRNSTTDAQDWWLDRLEAQGYQCRVAHGFDEAVRCVERYLREEVL